METEAIIIIPSRLGSTRLPNKPLADINGKPMVIRVAEQAKKSQAGRVIVATGDDAIISLAHEHGLEAIKTYKEHNSGTDRIFEAYGSLPANERSKYIINLQGDLPNIEPEYIAKVLNILKNSPADIATLVSEVKNEDEATNPSIVKAILTNCQQNKYNALRALYFTRATAPTGGATLYNHIGIYAYKKDALKRFVNLPVSYLETHEKLEQLRALENDMSIIAAIVNEAPIAIDTPDDLLTIADFYKNQNLNN